ncbi:hypothetical protein PTSG_12568 [Salpingoeca rosetta]|uniref:MPN domain-containing protein n=1 Tax=Salpingoeca rosetta (strain ATCC 50818 / BSB-021) TaxID=946362 RepID=F2UJ09_SALR5|nr:uncharacterized protein PTSG_12568 [Salpingoeca rosetta]EGD76957.1 hypothetical protein PTSG_12568 [Salpingoeca rosetta]|eukprot:XP_004990797.1 hypothetical protein PTSG_12568 [Salpingoeca rosetta]
MQPSSGEDDVTPERKMSVDRTSEGEDYGDGVQGRTMDTASDVVSGRSRRATTKLAPKTGASSKRQRKPNPFAPSIAETPTTTSTTPPPSTPTTTMETRKTATTKTRATAAPTPSPSRSQTQTPSNRSGVASTTPETQTPSIHPLHVTLCSLTFASLAFNSFRNTADEARDRGVRHGLLLGRFTRETVTSKDDDREHVSEERRACVVTGARPLPLSILDIMQSRGDALTHAISGDRDQVVGWFSTRTCDGITPTLHDKWLHRLVSTTFNPETCVGCVLRMAPDRTTTAKTTCSFYRHINGTFSRVTHELRVRHVQPYPPTTSSLGRGSGTLDFLQPSLQRWSLDADVAAMEAAVTEAIQKLLQLEEKLAATAIAAAVAASHNTPDLM